MLHLDWNWQSREEGGGRQLAQIYLQNSTRACHPDWAHLKELHCQMAAASWWEAIFPIQCGSGPAESRAGRIPRARPDWSSNRELSWSPDGGIQGAGLHSELRVKAECRPRPDPHEGPKVGPSTRPSRGAGITLATLTRPSTLARPRVGDPQGPSSTLIFIKIPTLYPIWMHKNDD